VLAEFAGQIAASGAEGEDGRAGQEMIERLLLDRVDAEAGRAAIGSEHHLILGARTYEAEPALALVQAAITRAQIALDASVLESAPIAARHPGDQVFSHTPPCRCQMLISGHSTSNEQRPVTDGERECAAAGGGRLVLSPQSGAVAGGGGKLAR